MVPGRAQVAALFLDAHLGAGADTPEETPAAERLLAHARATARWVAPFTAALGAHRARRGGVPPHVSDTAVQENRCYGAVSEQWAFAAILAPTPSLAACFMLIG
jgi:hypothetical protein